MKFDMEKVTNKFKSIFSSPIFKAIVMLVVSTLCIYITLEILNSSMKDDIEFMKLAILHIPMPRLITFLAQFISVRIHMLDNCVFILAIMLLIYSFVGRLRLSVGISAIFFFLFGVVNHILILSRATPFGPADIFSIPLALKMVGNFNFRISLELIWSLVIMLLLFLFIYKFKPLIIEKTERIAYRIISLVISLIIFVVFFTTSILNVITYWDTITSYKNYGFLISFMNSTKALLVTEPEGYSVETIEGIVNNFETEKDTQAISKEKPNIIAIMNESFADLETVYNLNLSEDNMPFIHSLKENTIVGQVHSSVLGGRTANCEFEFLTGHSSRCLPADMTAYQNYIREDTSSIVRMLLKQGYSCTVFHPYYSSGYNRNVVYPLLGFEDFKDISKLENLNELRYDNYTDDLSTYKNIIKLYENKKSGEKIFNFTVTMQNHTPYDSSEFENTIFLADFNTEKYKEINQYLSLIKLSDEAFEYLVNYFSNVEEKTIILMFGDHQPYFVNNYEEVFELNASLYDERRYLTPFILWANYDIEEENIGDISINYLANILFDTAELEKNQYFEFLDRLYKKYPIITDNIIVDANGQEINYTRTLAEQELKVYEFLQYNNLFDEKNRLVNVFN